MEKTLFFACVVAIDEFLPLINFDLKPKRLHTPSETAVQLMGGQVNFPTERFSPAVEVTTGTETP